MITCRLDIGVDLKHPLDILLASFETDSRLSICSLFGWAYTLHEF